MALHQTYKPNSHCVSGSLPASSSNLNNTTTLKRMPALLQLFCKAVISSAQVGNKATIKTHNKHPAIPKLSMRLNRIKPQFKQVKRYANVCHYNFDGYILPITFPHILAFNLQLKLMTHKRFPFPTMGLVHIRNTLTSHCPILMNESLNLHVFIGDAHSTDKGVEFTIHSQASVNHELVWESISTYLHIIKKATKKPLSKKELTEKRTHQSLRYHQRWFIPSNLGRKYALTSGDANPIHLHALSATLFGFKHPIVHGMWLKAHTIASLNPIIQQNSAVTASVEFKQAPPLNNKIRMNYQERAVELSTHKNKGIDFDIRSEDSQKLHMIGSITYSSA